MGGDANDVRAEAFCFDTDCAGNPARVKHSDLCGNIGGFVRNEQFQLPPGATDTLLPLSNFCGETRGRGVRQNVKDFNDTA